MKFSLYITFSIIVLLLFTDLYFTINETINLTLLVFFNPLLTIINVFITCLNYLNNSEALKKEREIKLKNQASKIYVKLIQEHLKAPKHAVINNKFFNPVLIGNSSDEPIYKALIISTSNRFNFKGRNNLGFSNNLNYIYIPILVKGNFYKMIRTDGNASGKEYSEAMIFFNDSFGEKWVRDPQGNLVHLDKNFDAFKFCNIIKPIISDLDEYEYTSLDELRSENKSE